VASTSPAIAVLSLARAFFENMPQPLTKGNEATRMAGIRTFFIGYGLGTVKSRGPDRE